MDNNKNVILVKSYLNNLFVDKETVKVLRDEILLPVLSENKQIILDFADVNNIDHTSLFILLATPIERLGLAAYKKIKIINASPDIRETLDFIFDDNTSND